MLAAVIEKVEVPSVVGVPSIVAERLPLAVFKARPLGNDPTVTVKVNVSVAIALFVAVKCGGTYAAPTWPSSRAPAGGFSVTVLEGVEVGALTSLIVSVKLFVVDAELSPFATPTAKAKVPVAFGVPESRPVPALSVSASGRVPEARLHVRVSVAFVEVA
jgi:hypothetical protein